MCWTINILLLFSLCGGVFAEVASEKLLVSSMETVIVHGLAAEGAAPVSDWPAWRSPQKGLAKRRPDAQPPAPLLVESLLHSTDTDQPFFTISLALFPTQTVRRYQSLQVYRL